MTSHKMGHDRRRPANPRRRARSRRRGFTLLEIIVVVTIIALLATLVAPRLLGNIGKSKRKIAQSNAASIAQQVNLWLMDNGYSGVPDDFDLMTLSDGDDAVLADDDLIDPWNNQFVLIAPGEKHRDFDIVSYGADGEPGGEGEDEDVVH